MVFLPFRIRKTSTSTTTFFSKNFNEQNQTQPDITMSTSSEQNSSLLRYQYARSIIKPFLTREMRRDGGHPEIMADNLLEEHVDDRIQQAREIYLKVYNREPSGEDILDCHNIPSPLSYPHARKVIKSFLTRESACDGSPPVLREDWCLDERVEARIQQAKKTIRTVYGRRHPSDAEILRYHDIPDL
jgi:hypothetical protein